MATEEVYAHFRAADVYLSCAHSDGTSISMVEALASGLPVVVTDLPSNREWIAPGSNGWLGRLGDAASFAGTVDGSRINSGFGRETANSRGLLGGFRC